MTQKLRFIPFLLDRCGTPLLFLFLVWISNIYMYIYLLIFFAIADMCIASAISLLMILICGMAAYGAYKVNLIVILQYLFFFFCLWKNSTFLSHKRLCRSCVPHGSSPFSAIKYLTLLSTPWWLSALWCIQTQYRITYSSW